VRGISFTVSAGEVLAFLGANGAGKTTTIKMIAGLVSPTSGRVWIEGGDPHRSRRALRHVGAVLEGSRNVYWRMTPLENIEYFGAVRGLRRREALCRGARLLERFGLSDKADTTAGKLSRGMQQKLAIVIALLHGSRLLLLDEPTLGLDTQAAEEVKRLVRDAAGEGCAVMLTTHQLSVAEEISDRFAIIRQGSIVVERATRDLLRQTAQVRYRVAFEGSLGPGQMASLVELGAEVRDGSLVYQGSQQGLYEVIATLRPCRLLAVDREHQSLTEVFLSVAYHESPS
jgi:ABC-2 type transport system ATP-binding protein